jgi:hypothetical protein
MNSTTYVNFMIIVALALGVVVVVDTVVFPMLEVWAIGCPNSQAFNASEGRCFRG